MDAESNLSEVVVSSNNGSTSGEPKDPTVLKEKLAEELKSAASLKGGGDGVDSEVPLEKDDLLERLDKIDTDSGVAADKPSEAPVSNNDVDMENDDLIQRLEAIEKGEDESTATKDAEDKKQADVAGVPVETNHQNGLDKENEAELLQEDVPKESVEEDKMEVDGVKEKKDDVSSAEPKSNGASNEEQLNQPTTSAKRRHSQDEESQNTEPSTKKLHVDEASAVDGTNEVETSEQKSEKNAEQEQPEEKEPVNQDENDKNQPDQSDEKKKPEEISTSEPMSTEESSIEAEEKKPSEESASPPDLDPNPNEEKKVDESSKEKITGNKPETSTVVDGSEEPLVKDEDKPMISERNEEVDSVAVVEQTVESSESSCAPIPVVEAETKPIEHHTENPDIKTADDKKIETTELKASEEKTDKPLAIEVQKPEKVDESKTKEPAENKPTEEEPTPSESFEAVPEQPNQPTTEPEKPEPLPEQTSTEAEPKAETLPDTESNTESSQEEQPTSSSPTIMEEKIDDAISSSSEKKEETTDPSSTEVDSASNVVVSGDHAEEQPNEGEAVTSSDEKPNADPDASQEVDSTPEVVSVVASEQAKDDEPMDVDVEPVAETSSKQAVAEPPCTKKEVYECTDESTGKESEVKSVEEAKETAPESATVSASEKQSNDKANLEEEEKMEVDSAAPTQSKSDLDVTESMNTTSEELIESIVKDDTAPAADSQSETVVNVSELNRNMDATENNADDSKVDTSKTLDDSIECSLPTSSSDKMADRLKQRLDLISNGSSTPNAAVSSSNVYNSTPIQKQFEISSENVSKISRHSVDHSHQADEDHSAITVGDQSSISDEKDAVVASTSGISKPLAEVKKQPVTDTSDDASIAVKDVSSLKTESSEVDSCTASSALNTADEINMYATNARKFNGISSTSGSELEDKITVTPTNVSTTNTPSTVVNKLDLTPALTSEEALFEVSGWFDGNDLQFLSIEKLENKTPTSGATAGSSQDLTGIDSSKQSSNGSVGSLGPFSLPPARPAIDSAMSHSTATETSSGTTSNHKSSLPKIKQTVRGAKALATLMIEEFTKIKRALSKDDEISDTEPATPMKTPRGRPASVTKKQATPARGQKRTRTDSDTTEEEQPKSKQAAKQTKKESKTESTSPSLAAPESTETAEPPAKKEDEQCCLARWSDRKYYAGKVTGYKGDNKFMVVFEDGASKALSKDVIVFGDKDTLPIMGHSIHALTGGDTYEPGIVQELKRNESDEVVYSVQIATGLVEVTASDMYLTEEQAKYINKACKAAETADEKNSTMQSPQTSGRRGANTPVMQTPEEASGTASAEKGARSTRRRGADKPQTPVTPEAGYSGGVGKKGRRGRRLS